jgi:mono/diheme cytochrome c family protein
LRLSLENSKEKNQYKPKKVEEKMRKSLSILLAVAIVSAIILAACGGGGQTTGEETTALDRPAPPAEYAGKTSPVKDDPAAADAGKEIYNVQCATCHGDTGQGDGPGAAALDPKPQPLAANAESLKEDYMFWRISEGGAFDPFNSAMPAWKATLSEDEIWQVIAYIHKLAGQ